MQILISNLRIIVLEFKNLSFSRRLLNVSRFLIKLKNLYKIHIFYLSFCILKLDKKINLKRTRLYHRVNILGP